MSTQNERYEVARAVLERGYPDGMQWRWFTSSGNSPNALSTIMKACEAVKAGDMDAARDRVDAIDDVYFAKNTLLESWRRIIEADDIELDKVKTIVSARVADQALVDARRAIDAKPEEAVR